jgi:hypothetical protein
MALSGKNLIAKISYMDLVVELTAEGASWNPDVADDLIKRASALWKESLVSMLETNAWNAYDVDLEDD